MAIERSSISKLRIDHVTPILHQLHWLPVRQRIEFKVIGFVYQSLTGQAPVYLADDCRLVSESDRRPLHSSDVPTCIVPRMRTRFGDRSFSAAAERSSAGTTTSCC